MLPLQRHVVANRLNSPFRCLYQASLSPPRDSLILLSRCSFAYPTALFCTLYTFPKELLTTRHAPSQSVLSFQASLTESVGPSLGLSLLCPDVSSAEQSLELFPAHTNSTVSTHRAVPIQIHHARPLDSARLLDGRRNEILPGHDGHHKILQGAAQETACF